MENPKNTEGANFLLSNGDNAGYKSHRHLAFLVALALSIAMHITLAVIFRSTNITADNPTLATELRVTIGNNIIVKNKIVNGAEQDNDILDPKSKTPTQKVAEPTEKYVVTETRALQVDKPLTESSNKNQPPSIQEQLDDYSTKPLTVFDPNFRNQIESYQLDRRHSDSSGSNRYLINNKFGEDTYVRGDTCFKINKNNGFDGSSSWSLPTRCKWAKTESEKMADRIREGLKRQGID